MSTIYLPSQYINNCNVVFNGYIRSYTNSNYTTWVDIYINQDYMEKPGSSNYSQTVICDSLNSYTSNEYYKLGQIQEWLSMFTLALVFSIFLINIRRCSRTWT